MKSACVAVWMVATAGLLALGGCNGATGDAADSNAEIKNLKTALEETQQQKKQLQGDVERLEKSLSEAESGLADAKKTRDELQKQVQDLSGARAELENKVDELSTARTNLQATVKSLVEARDTLEKQVAALTKAKSAALEDARVAQTKVDQLNDKIRDQTQQMIELQEQIKTVRALLQQLQQKLE